MSYKQLIASILFIAVTVSAQAAGDINAGKAKAGVCAGCHGVNGNSTNPAWPKLNGQHAKYIAKQLADFKSGKRKDPLMLGQVAGLSSQDMDNLAVFFAKQSATMGQADKSSEIGCLAIETIKILLCKSLCYFTSTVCPEIDENNHIIIRDSGKRADHCRADKLIIFFTRVSGFECDGSVFTSM